MSTQSTTPTPAPTWVPANYQLTSYVLTDVDGNARVIAMNANHPESVTLATAAVSTTDKSTFPFAAKICATPQPQKGQFEIQVELLANDETPDDPQVVGVVNKIMDTVSKIAISKAQELGFPTDKVIVFEARVRPRLAAVTTPVTIN